MKQRILAKTIKRAMKTFPAVVVTGPRQSGKTTLLSSIVSKSHTVVSLEDPDIRIRAKEDPRLFLERYKPPILIDEVQYVPELLSYIKTKIDAHRAAGQWLFTGSQNFILMEGVSQSLAGRAAVLTLLPFSFSEYIGAAVHSRDSHQWINGLATSARNFRRCHLTDYLLRGSFPEIASNKKIDRQLWCGSYIATYLERDVRNISRIGDLSQFERFVKLCATRTGQILNVSDMARDVGVSVPTARRWISLLETGHQIYLLSPYYRNIGKRIIKSPKLYFIDTALATYLLGLHAEEALLSSPHFGHLFETMAVVDIVKRFTHHGQMPSLYYIRTRDGLEIDVVLELGNDLHLIEIKSSMTITRQHAAGLMRMTSIPMMNIKTKTIIAGAGETAALTNDITSYHWCDAMAQ